MLDLTERADKELADMIELDPFGIEIRYPGDLAEPDAGEAERALALARKAWEKIMKVLGSD